MVPYVSKAVIAERLPAIFPEGTPHRRNCVSDIAASVGFVMLYMKAVAGPGTLLGRKHVYHRSGDQSGN